MKIELNNIYNMDCLEGMKYIEDKSIEVNEQKIIYDYTIKKKTLRTIALENYTNHHKIKKILQKNNI